MDTHLDQGTVSPELLELLAAVVTGDTWGNGKPSVGNRSQVLLEELPPLRLQMALEAINGLF